MKLFIFAGCIAVATALPTLLGSDHCTYGPSYWCSHVQHARQCGAIKHCMATVWKYNSQPVQSDAKCKVCVFGVTEARKLLKNNETQETIKEFLEKGCEMVPDQKLRDECLNITKEYMYLPVILQLLASDVDPEVVCTVIGMCTQQLTEPMSNDVATTTKGPSDLCKDCQKFFQDVEDIIKDKATEAQLEATLAVLCEQLGPLKAECKSLIKEYIPVLMDLLSTEFNPGVICRSLRLCNETDATEFRVKLFTLLKQMPMKSTVKSSVRCEICTQVMEQLQLMDRDPKTQQAIENFVYENVCDLFGQFKTQCQDLVKDYAPMVFEYLANELDPSVACKMLQMCTQVSAPKSRVTSLTVVKAEPTLFKTNPHPKATASVECVLCEFVLKELDAIISMNSSEAEMIEALDKVCSLLPSTISAECQEFVNEYGPAVIQLLVQDIDPARICGLLGLCARQSASSVGHMEVPNTVTDVCELCQILVNYVDSLLKENSTVQDIEKLLDKICNYLPGTLKTECDNFVAQYAPLLVQLAAQLGDPLKVCQLIGVCANSSVSHSAVPQQTNSLPHQAKTDNTLYYMNSGVLAACVQGPEMWCKDESTAAKCGAHAVAYCRRHIWTR